jgi:hypothetical protein
VIFNFEIETTTIISPVRIGKTAQMQKPKQRNNNNNNNNNMNE